MSETKRTTIRSARGVALPIVVVVMLILVIIGFSLLELARGEIVLTQKGADKTKAFYLAEAGLTELTSRLYAKEFDNIDETALGEGIYSVEVHDDEEPPYAVSTGQLGTTEKKVKVELSFLAPAFEHCVYALNTQGDDWSFSLRGQGNPAIGALGTEVDGKDMVNGNMYVDGDVSMYEEGAVNPAPWPNTHELSGDVDATGSIGLHDSASISGDSRSGAPAPDAIDLRTMNYQINNTHDVGQAFAAAGVSTGYLPADHELHDTVMKNPGDRSAECSSTAGDDYFFEPASGFANDALGEKGAATPLHMGDNRIYYIDGDVWVHSPQTYGFLVDGKVTIVATGDIHISDNIKYADDDSILGLVALGTYDDGGDIVSGGNIYFGDPRFGTTYLVSALMFAGNDFLYSTDSVTASMMEPTTGFSIFGNFAAMNQIMVERDWYTDAMGRSKPAHYDSDTGLWVDKETGIALTNAQVDGLRHYQMIIGYDDRVRTAETQAPGLPRGGSVIFSGLTHWEELP